VHYERVTFETNDCVEQGVEQLHNVISDLSRKRQNKPGRATGREEFLLAELVRVRAFVYRSDVPVPGRLVTDESSGICNLLMVTERLANCRGLSIVDL
jgi:hypothetical protein